MMCSHGFTFMCKECSRESAGRDKAAVANGTHVFITCAWREDGRYAIGQANGCKVFKRKSAAQKWCDTLNNDGLAMGANPRGYVVRFVPVPDGAVDSSGRVSAAAICTF